LKIAGLGRKKEQVHEENRLVENAGSGVRKGRRGWDQAISTPKSIVGGVH